MDPNGVIHNWFWAKMGEGTTWRINNDYLSGTYADTFINSLQMTYLAVVVLTCVCCVNVQTLRWSQMFGRHLCALINSMHAHAVHAHTDARTLHMYAATATHRFTHSHTHTQGLTWHPLGVTEEESLFPSVLVDICPVSSLNRLLAPVRTSGKHFNHCCKYLTSSKEAAYTFC